MFEHVYRVDQEVSTVSETDLVAVETLLGGAAPAGYRELVTRLGGDGSYAGYVRVYGPRRIMAEYEPVRRALSTVTDWYAVEPERATILASVIVADTVDGDQLFAHPASGRLLLLPCGDEGLLTFGYDLGEALHWLTTSGVLTDALPEPPTFETREGRSSIRFDGHPGLTPDTVVAALADIVEGARCDRFGGALVPHRTQFFPLLGAGGVVTGPGAVQYVPSIGGHVLVMNEGRDLWARLTAARSTVPDDVETVASALVAAGLRRGEVDQPEPWPWWTPVADPTA